MLATDVKPMIRKPRRICLRGAILPASRPLSQAPPMIPPMLNRKKMKYCVGARPRCSPRKTGAASTYRNMPLNGMPLASANSRKRRLPTSER